MSIHIYGKGFKHGHERGAFGEFLQDLYQRYSDSDTRYYVIGEWDADEANGDLLLISSTAVIIGEIKTLTAAHPDDAEKIHLTGKQNGPWDYLLPNGNSHKLGGMHNRKNPYQQIEDQRYQFAGWLSDFSTSIFGKPYGKEYFLNRLAGWTIIDPGFDGDPGGLSLPWESIKGAHDWFKLIPLGSLAWEFNRASNFPQGLKETQIETIISQLGVTEIPLQEVLPVPPTMADPFFTTPHICGLLIDRQEECSNLNAWLEDERIVLMSLRGLGGVGKTELAAWLCQHAVSKHRQVRWVDCAEKEVTVETFLSAIAQETRNHLQASYILDKTRNSLIDRMDTALNTLSARPTLIVFNDFHKVSRQNGIDPLLTHIVQHFNQLKVILVTREYPDCINNPSWRPGAMKDQPICGLPADFIATYIELDTGEKPPPDWEDILYERTSGNPYALKLIGALYRRYGWSEAIQQLPLFKSDQSPGSQLWFESLVETLSPKASDLAKRLSAVRGDLKQELINYLWHEPAEAGELTFELLNRFILQRNSAAAGSFLMHEFIREYLYSLSPEMRRTKFHKDAGIYYIKQAQGAGTENDKAELLLEALYHFNQGGLSEEIQVHARSCYNFLISKGDWDRAKSAAYYALAAAKDTHASEDASQWLVKIAERESEQDQLKEAGKHLQEALNLLPKTTGKPGSQQQRNYYSLKAQIFMQKGNLAYKVSDLESADRNYGEALNLAKEIPDQKVEAECLTGIGRIERQHGLYQEAETHFRQAEEIARSIPDSSLEVECISLRGLIYRRKGDFERARESFTRAYETATSSGDERAAEINYSLLGDLYHRQGQDAEAVPIFRKCLEISERLGNGIGIRINRGQLAEALISLGEYQEVEELLDLAEQSSKQMDDRIGQAWTCKRKGQLMIARGQIEQGNQLINQGMQILREIGNEDYLPDFEKALGPRQLNFLDDMTTVE